MPSSLQKQSVSEEGAFLMRSGSCGLDQWQKSNPEDVVSLGGEPKSSVSPRPGGLKRDMHRPPMQRDRGLSYAYPSPQMTQPHTPVYSGAEYKCAQEGREDQKGAGAFDKGRTYCYLWEGVAL